MEKLNAELVAHCEGCRPRGKMCAFVKKRCEKVGKNQVEFCFECGDFPCEFITKLDKRYQKNYDYSFIENLKQIKEHGMEAFLESEYKKYKCQNCGDIKCIHNGKCYSCQTITTWRG